MSEQKRPHLICVDLGGTSIKAGLFDPEDQLCDRHEVKTGAEDGPTAVLEGIAGLYSHLAGAHSIAAVGVCAPGPLDPKSGTVYTMPNLPGWEKFPLAQSIAELVRRPVTIENDANAAALGEWKYGAARGCDNALVLTIGTGIGGGFIVDGRLLRGADSLAGEPGHMSLDPNGPVAGSGMPGALESYASATAARYEARRLMKLGWESPYLHRHLDKEGLPPGDLVLKGAMEGDRVSVLAIEYIARNLGIGIASLVNLLNPALIVLGGGYSVGFEFMEPLVRHELRSRAFQRQAETARLVKAELGNDAALWGMLSLLR